MGYLRGRVGLGGDYNCSDVMTMYTRPEARKGRPMTAAEWDCTINGEKGLVRMHNDHFYDRSMVDNIKALGIVKSDLPRLFQAVLDNVAKSSKSYKIDAVKKVVEQDRRTLDAPIRGGIKLRTQAIAQAPRPSAAPPPGMFHLGPASPAADPVVSDPSGMYSASLPAAPITQVDNPGPGGMYQASIPGGAIAKLPLAVAGIPMTFVAIGGAALLGLYLVTRKKKGH